MHTIIQIIYMFGIDLQVYEVEKLVDVGHNTVIDWYKQLRLVCKEALDHDPIKLGETSTSIVEIDESLFGKKRKYHRGTGKQNIWVFGMIEKGTQRVKLEVVEKRDRATLMPIIVDNINQGTTVCSDCWRPYSTLPQEGFIHKTVNHSVQFKADDGTCTNEIEGIWGMAKLKIKERKGLRHEHIPALLDEFCYRYRYGNSNGDIFYKLLHDVARYMRLFNKE